MTTDRNLLSDIAAFSFRNIDPLAGHQASYLSSLQTAVQMAGQLVPDVEILAGGPAFSIFGKQLMQKIPRIDIGMIGEGEPSFELLLFGTYSPARVPGIIWRKNGSLVVNASLNNAVSPKLSMDRIPVPDTNAFDPKAYTRGNSYVAPIGIEAICGAVTACIPFWAEPGCGFAALKKLWMRCKCLPKNSTLTCFTLQTAW